MQLPRRHFFWHLKFYFSQTLPKGRKEAATHRSGCLFLYCLLTSLPPYTSLALVDLPAPTLSGLAWPPQSQKASTRWPVCPMQLNHCNQHLGVRTVTSTQVFSLHSFHCPVRLRSNASLLPGSLITLTTLSSDRKQELPAGIIHIVRHFIFSYYGTENYSN
jgi:hypothetical protein